MRLMAAGAVQPLSNFLPAVFGNAEQLHQIPQFGMKIKPDRPMLVGWLAMGARGELRLHATRKFSQLLLIKTIVGI